MPIELNLENDFSTILDGGEPLTLRRRGTTTTIAVPVAWRYTSLTQAAEPGIAGVTRGDVAWQFEWDSAVAPPHVGDQLIDAANDFWTILSVEIRGNSSRLRCHARNLRVTFALDDRVAIQAALWDTSGPTPVITGWFTKCRNTPKPNASMHCRWRRCRDSRPASLLPQVLGRTGRTLGPGPGCRCHRRRPGCLALAWDW